VKDDRQVTEFYECAFETPDWNDSPSSSLCFRLWSTSCHRFRDQFSGRLAQPLHAER